LRYTRTLEHRDRTTCPAGTAPSLPWATLPPPDVPWPIVGLRNPDLAAHAGLPVAGFDFLRFGVMFHRNTRSLPSRSRPQGRAARVFDS